MILWNFDSRLWQGTGLHMRACTRYIIGLLALVAGLVGATVARSDDKDTATPKPIRVLFVGNSQIYYNDMPRTLELLSESAPKDRPRIKAGRALTGGATLEYHWNKGTSKDTPRSKITEEKWDYVVIQEYSSVASPENFTKYAKLFHDLIRPTGAQTVLFATAYFPSPYPKPFQDLHDSHVALSRELKVPLAAGGKAWMTFLGDNSTLEQRLDLFDKDKGHPGKKGSYLYACTFYALVTGSSPVGLTHRLGNPEQTITPDEAKRFQEAAWQVHQEVNGKPPQSKP